MTVLVTGGTVRLGKALAARLAADGWQVLTSSHRSGAGADFVSDLSEPQGADRLMASVRAHLGGRLPEALVNNAALFAGDETAIRAVNLGAPQRLTRLMAERAVGMGAVVNVLDATSERADTQAPEAYRETKRALRVLTTENARAFASTLRVNAVSPGPVLAPTGVHEKAGAILLARRPTAEDVAAAVSFLLSAEAVTGVVLPVDAGHHLREGR